LHEIRDQAEIISRLVDFFFFISGPQDASALVAKAVAAMASRRRGPAVLECAIDVWGRSGPAPLQAPLTPQEPTIDEDAIVAAATALGAAKRPLIICGGGAQGAAPEVTALAHMLQAPMLGYRRGRGVLDSRDPSASPCRSVGSYGRKPMSCSRWHQAPDPASPMGDRRRVAVIRVDSDPRSRRGSIDRRWR
jgi:acetolactate synthase-1/2/3 large subunit